MPSTYGRVLNYKDITSKYKELCENFVPGNFLYFPSYASELLFFNDSETLVYVRTQKPRLLELG